MVFLDFIEIKYNGVKNNNNVKIGFSKDIHKLFKNKNRRLILGGIEIKNSKWKIKAHSDGDLIIHAFISSILSIINEKTLGELYPENANNKDIDSTIMLRAILNKLKQQKTKLISADFCIVCEKIMLKDYLETIKKNLIKLVGYKFSIGIKATRFENKHNKYIECYCALLAK